MTMPRACDQLLPVNMKYNTAWRGTLELEPMTSCGFYLYQYSAFLDITWQWPNVLYHRDYKTITAVEVEYIEKTSDPNGRFPGNNCMNQECQKNYYVTYGK